MNHYKFTGYERDGESGNDYAMARYFSSQYGRFMTPDPAGLLVADTSNPQSWNQYTYVGNNPTNLTDPTGLFGIGDVIVPPVSPDPVTDILIGIFDIFSLLFGRVAGPLKRDLAGA